MEKMKDFIPDLKWNIMAFIINLMSGIIVIIEGFYSFGYWIIVKLMPVSCLMYRRFYQK